MASSALPYACVARVEEQGTCTILAESSLASGNAAEITRKILRKLPPASAGSQRSFSYEAGYTFHILSDRATVLVCMERGLGTEPAFAFLSRAQHQWGVAAAPTQDCASALLGSLRSTVSPLSPLGFA